MTCSGSDHTADPGLGPRCSPGVQCSSHAPSCQLEDLPPHSCTPTPGPGKERPVWKQVWNRGNQRCQSSPILTAQHPSLPMFLSLLFLDSHPLCQTSGHSQGLLLFSLSNGNKHRKNPAKPQHGKHATTETRGTGQ